MADFNTLRIDLIRRLSLCGAWDGKLYWYKDTIQLLKKMMQFVPPTTNADRILSMTDEELAKFISGKARTFGEEYEGYMSALDWLRQEATE